MTGSIGVGVNVNEGITEELRRELIKGLDFSRDLTDEEVRDAIRGRIISASRDRYIPIRDMNRLTAEIFDSVRRLGPLQRYIDDESISEIMVNGPSEIFLERNGHIERAETCLMSEEQLENIIQIIVSSVNRSVNEANPIVDARLSDGSRVNVVLPPIALNGAIVTIRKFPKQPMSMERLLNYGTIDEKAASFIEKIVAAGCNIIVSGGTSSGKTSFLNALSEFIPKRERVIVMEDSAELQLTGIPNLVRLETRNANIEGKGEIGIADLIKSSLRMRPDRIVVGEVRDGLAAVNLLNAFNTGHIGESTIHSNSASDTISRLETLLLTGSSIPLAAAERQIASAVDYIIYLGRLSDGRRKCLEICELEGVYDESIKLRKIFSYDDGTDSLAVVEKPAKSLVKLMRAGEDIDGLFDI